MLGSSSESYGKEMASSQVFVFVIESQLIEVTEVFFWVAQTIERVEADVFYVLLF